MNTIFGYWRCSTDAQDQERQIRSLKEAGVEVLKGDKITGTSDYADRKELSKLLDEIKELHLHDFGIYIELHPDEEEKGILEQNIQTSLSAGKIDIDDAIDVRSINNVKIASQVLKVRKKRKEELDAKRKQENIQQQSQANQQAAQAAESAKQQTMSVKIQTESQMKQLEFDLELQRMQKEFELKSMLLEMQSLSLIHI